MTQKVSSGRRSFGWGLIGALAFGLSLTASSCQDKAEDDFFGHPGGSGGAGGSGTGGSGDTGSGGGSGNGGSGNGDAGQGCATACQSGQQCSGGACVCMPGLKTCRDGCVDFASDARNCGLCERACAANQVCSEGACAAGCAGGLTQCGQSCVDTSTSVAHCGGCDNRCPAGVYCDGGSCRCPSTMLSCQNGCVDPNVDDANCGACGIACTGGMTCQAGDCACAAGMETCDGACHDTSLDPEHCGTCNNACSSGICIAGKCTTVTDGGLIGWASVEGSGLKTTTGGQGGSTIEVDTPSELEDAMTNGDRRIILVSGTLDVGALEMASNTTLIGVGTDATLLGGISIDNQSNVIIQNLRIDAATSSAHSDGIHVEHSHHVWIDHCEIWDAPDGNLDITHQSDFVTVSWTRFWYSSSPGNNAHRFSVLIGANDTDPDEGTLNVTFHHNWWAERVVERMPRVRFGKVHIFNNYFSSSGNNHCVRAAYEADVLVENNYFEDVGNPHEIDTDDGTAVMSASGNTYDGTTGSRETRGTAFTPPYPFQLQPADGVRAAVQAGCGPQ
jgi:pectate lyase